ncbi:helicase DnaB [Paenibacillus turpanensis]|uniref:helicase DnaB n=1 Tax=Paenibacillus turpanensis TaxID=2689078 RepID=UPI00140C33A4|nr:helicase DnaB [Paenibacillus turpanensis]
MRMTNLLHFTENHRFCVYRNFSLSPLDHKMLTNVYQPMVGAFAISLYSLLFQQLEADRVGFSNLELQRKLFVFLNLEPNDIGRKQLVDQCSKLEAIGLLRTTRKLVLQNEETVFEYHLLPPLSPEVFFATPHLVQFLREKFGSKTMVIYMQEAFISQETELTARADGVEDLTMEFSELFRLSTSIDLELEQALAELAPAKADAPPSVLEAETKYDYAQIISRIPRTSPNRLFVEQLKFWPERLQELNYLVMKYRLSLMSLAQILDEDDVFSDEGELLLERVEHHAFYTLYQNKSNEEAREMIFGRREAGPAKEEDISQEESEQVQPEMSYYLEVPAKYEGEYSIHRYNAMLRNEPYTHVLPRFFPRKSVPKNILSAFDKAHRVFKLKEEVINVLIHHIHVNNLTWGAAYIESVAGDMLGKHIESYESAVQYVRDKTKQLSGKRNTASAATGDGKGRKQGTSAKPKIPMAEPPASKKSLTNEDIERIRKLAQTLDGK